MELPICKAAYSNESDVSDVDFLEDVMRSISNYKDQEYRTFFVGLCFHCNEPGRSCCPSKALQRCNGCQLVSYCSKECQKNDWNVHKYVCKEFPVRNGKNALCTNGHWKSHISGLRQRAARLPLAEGAAIPIFHNPRVCRTCREAHQDLLVDCKCAAVSYCSTKCARKDKVHQKNCVLLAMLAQTFSRCFRLVPQWYHRDLVCEKFRIAETWDDVLAPHSLHVDCKYSLNIERFSYPMTLLYALQSLPKRHLANEYPLLEDITTLDVHIVTSNPMLDSVSWELFMHRLPKLKQLNLVFLVQGKTRKQFLDLNKVLISLERCDDCEAKNRVITYSVHQMQYHMFFSSQEYTEPNVVVVYGNTHEMSENEDEVHSQISYRNMTYSKNTVLVLTDVTKGLVMKGVRAVNTACSVDQLVSPRINALRGFSSTRTDIDSDTATINEKQYFTCLRRK